MAAGEHLDSELLVAFHEGRLDETQLACVVEHIVSCDCCREKLDGVEGGSALSRRLRQGMVIEPTANPGMQSWVRELQQCTSLPPSRFGDYRIVREIGRGGMGVVYEAHQESLGRRVALKVLPFHAAADRQFIDRFRRESQAVARLHHTNIVPVFSVGEHGGLPYFAMQYIPGRSLAAVLEALRVISGPGTSAAVVRSDTATKEFAAPSDELDGTLAKWLMTGTRSSAQLVPTNDDETAAIPRCDVPIDTTTDRNGRIQKSTAEFGRTYFQRVAQIGIQVAEALAHAHHCGVLHRDIKPSNLLLDTTGAIWLTDFGLAKLADAGEFTESGALLGTLRYMAPERFRGTADARGDIYGLGATLYELLALQAAFQESDREQLIRQVLQEDPLPPRALQPRIPKDLETIVLKAMAKDPEARYPTARQLADDLRRFVADEPIAARRAPIWERLWRWCHRNPAAAAANVLAGITLLALIGLGLGYFVHVRTQDALAFARSERRRAEAERRQSDHLSVRLALERGLALCEQGESGRGLLWLSRTLELATARADPLANSTRVNLAGWSKELHLLRFTFQHSAMVNRAAFSPDSRYLITVGEDRTVEVRDVETGSLTYPPLSEPTGLHDIAISTNGKSLATTGDDGTVRMFDLSSGKPGAVLKHDGMVVLVSFSPDGRWVITTQNTESAPRPIQIWDAMTSRPVGQTEAAQDNINAIAVSPDGRTLAAATWQQVKVFRIPSGEFLGTLPHDEWAVGVAFSADGRTIATASWDGTAKVWDAETLQPRVPALQHPDSVYSVAFSPSGDILVTACEDGAARLWNVDSGTLDGLPLQHQSAVNAAAFSPDGAWVATASDDGTVRVWDARDGFSVGPPLMHRDKVESLVVSSNGRYAAAASRDGSVRVWELRPRNSHGLILKHRQAVSAVAFRPDGQVVLTGSWDKTARLWNTNTGEPAGPTFTNSGRMLAVAFSPDGSKVLTAGYGHSAQVCRADTGDPVGQPLQHQDAIRAIAFSGDGRFIATASGEINAGGTAIVWNASTGEPAGLPIRHRGQIGAIAFSPDGKLLLTGSLDGAARLWSSGSGEPASPWLKHRDSVNALAFSPSGELAVTASSDRTAKIWHVVDNTAVPLVLPHEARVLTLACSPSGNTVVTGCSDGTARLWDSIAGTPLGIPMLHQGAVHAVAFSADGQWLATASADGTARLWDTASGEPLGMPLRHRGPVYAVAFSPVGRQLLSGSRDATARLWQPPEPVLGSVERVSLWVQVLTGMSLDQEGIIRVLGPDSWQDHRRRLDALGGPLQ